MNPKQTSIWLKLQERQAIALESIVKLLQHNLPRPPAPNYKAILQNFKSYDWSAIGAEVEFIDSYGVASVRRLLCMKLHTQNAP